MSIRAKGDANEAPPERGLACVNAATRDRYLLVMGAVFTKLNSDRPFEVHEPFGADAVIVVVEV